MELPKIDPEQYAAAIAVGATPAEIAEVFAIHPFIIDTVAAYADAREAGATHPECVQAMDSVGDLGGYAEARWAGADHAECIDCGDEDVVISDYARLRDRGLDHSGAIGQADRCNEGE